MDLGEMSGLPRGIWLVRMKTVHSQVGWFFSDTCKWNRGKVSWSWGILWGGNPVVPVAQMRPRQLRLLVCFPSPQWREERFRQTSESTNQRVLWWSILQTLILVAIGVWQMRHLKSFFEAKKLV